MNVPPQPPPKLPDPRGLLDGGVWLAEWCAAQPERSTKDKVLELAQLAGCSPTTMHFVIRGSRLLSPRCARALVSRLGLPPEQAEHLLGVFELPHLPPKVARGRREQLLQTMAASRGVPWGASSALIEEQVADEAVIAALAPALAALEEDRPTPGKLLRSAVPPMTRVHLDAALKAPARAIRLGPRLLRLRDPDPRDAEATPSDGFAHLGMLSFAQDALLRLSSRERDYRAFVASCDEEGFLAFDGLCRWYESELAQLAEDAELRKPERVVALMVQRLVAAGPFPAGASAGGQTWKKASFQLPLLEEPLEDPAPSTEPVGAHPRPHPTGVTWFPTWLAIWRAWAERAGQPHSDAWLAKQTGLPRASIYDLATGATRFASRHVFPFLAAFGLEKDRAGQAALEGMAMVAEPNDPQQQARLIAALRAMGIEKGTRVPAVEAHFVQSQWYASVLRCLPDLQGFQALPGWVSRTLKGRIDGRAAEEALIALGVVGVLRRDAAGRTVVVEPTVREEGPHGAIAHYELHHGLLGQHRAELDNHDPDLSAQVYLLGMPEKAVPRLQRILDGWSERALAILEATQARRQAGGRMDRVIIVSRQCFALFRLGPVPKRGAARRRAAPPSPTGA